MYVQQSMCTYYGIKNVLQKGTSRRFHWTKKLRGGQKSFFKVCINISWRQSEGEREKDGGQTDIKTERLREGLAEWGRQTDTRRSKPG